MERSLHSREWSLQGWILHSGLILLTLADATAYSYWPPRTGINMFHQGYRTLKPDMKRSAGTTSTPGEHFGRLGNILDQNLCGFVVL